MKCWLRRLRCRRADAPLQTIVVFFVVFILISIVMEYGRGLVITNGVRDSLDRSVISVATDNVINSYTGFREGSSAAKQFDGVGIWNVIVDESDVTSHLLGELGLETKEYGKLAKYRSDGTLEYTIADLTVEIEDADSMNPDRPITFITKATIQIPMKFVGVEFQTNTKVTVRTRWRPKFG